MQGVRHQFKNKRQYAFSSSRYCAHGSISSLGFKTLGPIGPKPSTPRYTCPLTARVLGRYPSEVAANMRKTKERQKEQSR